MSAAPPFPSEAFDQHSAVIGTTGSGKSYLARGIVEGWLGHGLRVCIVDPTDVWYGLRSNAAGDAPGFPVVVFGGDHADVPIGARSGERIGEIVAGRNLPAIVATAEMTGGERHSFMTDFLETLYRRNKGALHLVLDEADELAPQNPLPETRRTLGAIDRIVRRGRVRGFRVLMITQRPAVLHNNVLAMARTVAALQLTLPHDRDALERWMKGQADPEQGREVLNSLPVLAQGEGWVWSPAQGVLVRRKFPAIATFDSMRTPEHGEAIAEPTSLAPVEIADLRALLATDTEPVADLSAKRKSPVRAGAADAASAELQRLRHHNAELHEALRQAEQQRDRWEAIVLAIYAAFEPFLGRVHEIDVSVEPVSPASSTAPKAAPSPSPAARLPAAPQAGTHSDPDAREERSRAATQGSANGALPSSAVKMLGVLARGMKLTWAQTATLAGLKARGGHFNAGRKALRDGGYVVEEEDTVAASQQGVAAAGGRQPKPTTTDEIVEWWRSALPPTPGRVLDQLYRQGPKWLRKERIAEFLGLAPRGGHWNGALSILRQNGLVEIKGDQLRASPNLWSRP